MKAIRKLYNKKRELFIAPDSDYVGFEDVYKKAYSDFKKFESSSYILSCTCSEGLLERNGNIPFYKRGFSDREIGFYCGSFDRFTQSQKNLSILQSNFKNDLKTFLVDYAPDIIHIYSLEPIGVEVLRVIKNTLPSSTTILYLLDKSMLFGIMENKKYPISSFAKEDIKLKEEFIKYHFAYVDKFVFLNKRIMEAYVNWVVPKKKSELINDIKLVSSK